MVVVRVITGNGRGGGEEERDGRERKQVAQWLGGGLGMQRRKGEKVSGHRERWEEKNIFF